jgi:hypothetical protein
MCQTGTRGARRHEARNSAPENVGRLTQIGPSASPHELTISHPRNGQLREPTPIDEVGFNLSKKSFPIFQKKD